MGWQSRGARVPEYCSDSDFNWKVCTVTLKCSCIDPHTDRRWFSADIFKGRKDTVCKIKITSFWMTDWKKCNNRWIYVLC